MTTQNSWNAAYNDGKGELLVGNNTRPVVVPVGADGLVLTADSVAAEGVSWQAGFNPANTAAFLVALTTTSSNVTGAGATYNFGTGGGGAVTTVFDNGGNITTPGGVVTFTAPVTGRYFLQARMALADLTAAMTAGTIFFVSSTGKTVQGDDNNVGATRDVNNVLDVEASIFVDMVAGESYTVRLIILNGAGNTADVQGGAVAVALLSWFSGFLVSTAGGVSGVFGPGVSTDRAIVTWNGITGSAQYDNPTTRITAAGEMTNTGQPAFTSFLSATDSNVTGAGTVYLFGSGNALTITQQGTGLAANGVYTAPVTGFYHFSCALVLGDITALMTSGDATFLINGATSSFGQSLSFAAVRNASNGYVVTWDMHLFLTAADTVQPRLVIAGGVGDTVDVGGGASTTSKFSGCLLC